jgi:carboxylate-amine ligase
MNATRPIPLFGAYGVELEYMIVHRRSGAVMPIAEQLLKDRKGRTVCEVQHGAVCWSNELAAHLIELKTTHPVASLRNLEKRFGAHIAEINRRLRPHNAMLMPTGAHPWMNPRRETHLWRHGNREIYHAFHKVFDCRGHGWVNLQSCHFNLPFRGAEEFGRLHAAVRLLLPLLPALAASSPILENRATGWLDTRLREYRLNCRRVPSVTANVVPERVFTPAEYRRRILQPMYGDIAPLDPEGILQYEWLNARGAIARFERNTIEIRVLDVQECPLADCAILEFCAAALKLLISETWTSWPEQKAVSTRLLADLLMRTARSGGRTRIKDAAYAAAFGVRAPITVKDLLWSLNARVRAQLTPAHQTALSQMLAHGSLAERILKAVGLSPKRIRAVYAELCECLCANRFFLP